MYNLETIDLIIIGFLALQFIVILVLSSKISKLNKRFSNIVPKNEDLDLEAMLIDYNKNIQKFFEQEQDIKLQIEENKQILQGQIDENIKKILLTNDKMKKSIQKQAVIRYNPFDDVGGDFCYATVFLNDFNDGILINSMYSREGCYSYAKEIINGKSQHKLGDEEQRALEIAINS